MHNFVSLMLFTFTAQAAIGMVLVNTAMLAAGYVSTNEKILIRSRHLVSLLLIIALATAFFHLGKPFRAVYALSNVCRSPLSMEIASLSLLLAISLADSWLSMSSGMNTVKRVVPFLSVVAALLLLVTMTAIYLIPAVPSWHNFRTPLSFALTAVSGGTAVIAILMPEKEVKASRRLLLVAACSALLLMSPTITLNLNAPAPRSALVVIQSAILVMALIMIIPNRPSRKMNKSYHSAVISGTLVLLSVLIARLLFFLSYDNNIL